MAERFLDSENFKKGNVIRAQIPNATDPTKVEKRLLWIRGDNGVLDLNERTLIVEDQLLRPEAVAVLDVLNGKIGPYDVLGVYTPEQIEAVDPRIVKLEKITDTSNDSEELEPIDSSKLGPDTVVRLSTQRKDIWPDKFNARLINERVIRRRKIFDMEDEFGNLYEHIPEKDILRRRHDWMRFDGIVPQNGSTK